MSWKKAGNSEKRIIEERGTALEEQQRHQQRNRRLRDRSTQVKNNSNNTTLLIIRTANEADTCVRKRMPAALATLLLAEEEIAHVVPLRCLV